MGGKDAEEKLPGSPPSLLVRDAPPSVAAAVQLARGDFPRSLAELRDCPLLLADDLHLARWVLARVDKLRRG